LTRTGCVEYTIEMLRAFQQYNTKVIVNNSIAHRYKDKHQTINTYSGIISFIISTFKFFFSSKKMIHKLKNENKEIAIYLPSFHYWNYIIAFRAKRLNIPCWLTVHDFKTHKGEKNILLEWVQKKTMRICTNIIFLSINEIKKAQRQDFSRDKFFHLPHPLFKVKSTNKLTYNKKPNLLFIGRIKKYKGINILVEAVKGLNIERLTIAGSGKLNFSLQSNINHINEFVSEEKLYKYLDTHEILILPYKEVSQSGVLSLGLSKGIVMIMSNLPGLKEQIPEGSYLSSEPTIASLKQAIEKLIHNENTYNSIKTKVHKERIIYQKEWQIKFNNFIDLISSE